MTAPYRSSEVRPDAAHVRSWLCALAVGALVCAPGRADAARVSGKIDGFRQLQNPVWSEAKDPKNHGYSFREPVPSVRSDFRRPFPHIPKEICIVAIGSEAQKPAAAVLVRVGGGRTTPVTIVVPPGTRLSFQNTDPFKHRLYAVGLKTFSASETAQGATRDWTVPEPGTYEIRDEAAPSVRMWIVAEPNVAAIAYPSMKGEFSLNLEVPGDYMLQAYFAGKKVGSVVPVTVAAKDLDVSKTPLHVGEDKSAAKDDKASDKPRGPKAKEGAK
jgi:plastocyanin